MKATISELAEVQIGYQSRGRINPDPKGTHQIIQIKDICDKNKLNVGDLYRVVPEREPERYLVNPGDVLFLSRGRCNMAVAIKEPLSDTIAAGTFYIVRVRNQGILPEYLAWYINQPQAQAGLRSRAQATSIPLVTKAAFESLEIAIPVLRVQRRIVELAGLVSREKALLSQLAQKQEQMISAVCLRAAKRLSQE